MKSYAVTWWEDNEKQLRSFASLKQATAFQKGLQKQSDALKSTSYVPIKVVEVNVNDEN